MAVKVANQITVVDLTDGYSVILSNESVTWAGSTNAVLNTQQATTQVTAMCGTDLVPCTVGTITCPNGLSAVSDGKTPSPTITITATTALTKAGEITIPITIDGEVTINKKFSWGISYTGKQGAKGDKGETGEKGEQGEKGDQGETGKPGADALTLVISSSNGSIFKNTAIATTLTALVYQGGKQLTGTALKAVGTIKWYKDDSTTAIATGETLTISAGDVDSRASYIAKLEG